MNLQEKTQILEESILDPNIDSSFEIETAHAADGWLHGVLALGIPYMGILLPIIIVFIVFYFQAKENRDKYNALIEVSKNVEDPDVVEDLLKSFKEEKKRGFDVIEKPV